MGIGISNQHSLPQGTRDVCKSDDDWSVEVKEWEVIVMLRKLRLVVLEVHVWILICELDFILTIC